MGQVASVRQIEGHDAVVWLQHCRVRLRIRSAGRRTLYFEAKQHTAIFTLATTLEGEIARGMETEACLCPLVGCCPLPRCQKGKDTDCMHNYSMARRDFAY